MAVLGIAFFMWASHHCGTSKAQWRALSRPAWYRALRRKEAAPVAAKVGWKPAFKLSECLQAEHQTGRM